jgi:hypothetical protein
MYSRELLYKITKNNNCFRNKNLRAFFNSDCSSGRNTFRVKDCAFLDRNRVYIGECQEGCQVQVTKVCVKRNKGKKFKGSWKQNLCEKTVSICKVRTNKRVLGCRVNKMRSICNTMTKSCKKSC